MTAERIGLVVDPTDGTLHLRGQLLHEPTVVGVEDGTGGVAPRIEDELGVAVVGDDPAEAL